jgi:hypothetical protein
MLLPANFRGPRFKFHLLPTFSVGFGHPTCTLVVLLPEKKKVSWERINELQRIELKRSQVGHMGGEAMVSIWVDSA